MTVLMLEEIGGGSVDVFCQNCSSAGYEVYMCVTDFNAGWGCGATGDSTAIMDPKHARKLAEILLKEADECERLNNDKHTM